MTWVRKIEVYVYAWDAGTEEGDDYRLNNAGTNPQGTISAFMAGDTVDAVFVSVNEDGSDIRVLPVGVLTFELQESSAKCMTSEPSGPTASPTMSPSKSPIVSPTALLIISPTATLTKKPKKDKKRRRKPKNAAR